jgi:hypothetical protein
MPTSTQLPNLLHRCLASTYDRNQSKKMAMDEGQITRSFSLRMYGKAAYTQAASVHGAQKPTHNRMHVFASR